MHEPPWGNKLQERGKLVYGPCRVLMQVRESSNGYFEL